MTTAPSLNDTQAERALIGAVLVQPGVVGEIDVKPGDFYDERNQAIWRVILDVVSDNQSPDIIAVTGRLGPEKLSAAGGEKYLIGLTADCPNSMNYREYASQVIKIARKREALAIASKIAALAANPDTAPETLAEVLKTKAAEYANRLDTSEQAPRDPWTPFYIADALQDRPPVEYITAGLFPLPSLNIVYGAPGCLKSFVLADLALSAAAGAVWLPPAPWSPGETGFITKQNPVMWLDFDNGEMKTHERLGALARARDLPGDTPFYYYSMPLPWLDASKPESVGMLALRAKNHGVKLIIIDNLGTVSGGVDENSGDMIGVLSNLRLLSEDTGAAVILIHHQRKSNGLGGRAGDSLRGHSSIEAAIDLALHVEREPDSDTITIKSTKTRGVDVLPFSAVLTFTHKENTDDLETARFYGLASEDSSSVKAIEREIIAALTGAEMNQTELVKAAKEKLEVGENRIIDMIKRLVKQKKIAERNGLHNAKIYTLR